MANVINRMTKVYLESVNTPDYPVKDWIINPVLPACDKKHWIIEGDTVREMNQAEKEDLVYSTESTIYLISEKQLLTGKNGHEYENNTDAIINPAMPACDLKYTKVVGKLVLEMTIEEKAVVNAPQIEKGQSATDINEIYPTALAQLDTVINSTNLTNEQIITSIKTEATILKKLLKFIKLNMVSK